MPQQADTSKMRSNQQPNGSAGSDAQPPKTEALDTFKSGMARNAHDLSSEIAHVASDVAGQAKHVAEAKLHEGKNFAGDQLGAVAEALRSTSDVLRSKDSAITNYVEKAANSIDDVSVYLGTRTLAQLINDVEGFARREPAIFLGTSFFAGLLGGRFLKAATPSLRPQLSQGAQGMSGPSMPKNEMGQGSHTGQANQTSTGSSASSSTKDQPANGQSPSPSSTTSTSTQKGPGQK